MEQEEQLAILLFDREYDNLTEDEMDNTYNILRICNTIRHLKPLDIDFNNLTIDEVDNVSDEVMLKEPDSFYTVLLRDIKDNIETLKLLTSKMNKEAVSIQTTVEFLKWVYKKEDEIEDEMNKN